MSDHLTPPRRSSRGRRDDVRVSGFEAKRLAIIRAVAADDVLASLLVLKGGNALRLIHRIGDRASLDVDYSLVEELEELRDIGDRLRHALDAEFHRQGFEVIDFRFEPRPSRSDLDLAEGFHVEFKLTTRERRARFRGRRDENERVSASAQVVGSRSSRTLEIDISRREYCGNPDIRDLEGFRVRVCSPELIAAEKLRALCQQVPEYTGRQNKTERARDFYDLHLIVSERGLDFASGSFRTLVGHTFRAKSVPIELIERLKDQREFHRPGWPDVELSVRSQTLGFDFYFDFVVGQCARLHPLGMVDPP